MAKSKKLLLTTLSVALVAIIAVFGTVAYLTSTDSDVNVMTVGNVKIEQLEYERVTDENGDFVEGVEGEDFDAAYGISDSYKLQKFTQAKPAYPAVYSNGGMAWDEFQQLWNGVGAPGSNDLFDDSMKNVVDKFVFVENTGKSDAYYRTIVAVELPEGIDEDMIHINFNSNSRFDYNDEEKGVQNSAESNGFYTTIDGVRYLVYTATYTEVLKPGEVSRPSLLQVYLDPTATNEVCAAFGKTWDILVASQAVQTNGFAGADEALDEAFGNIDKDNHPWAGEGNEPVIPEVVDTADELAAALTAGEAVVLDSDIVLDDTVNITAATEIDLNGHDLTVSVLEAKADTDISNGTLIHGESTYPALSVSAGTLTMENVKIVCEEPCNIVTSGTAQAAEYAALEVWSGKCVLNNCVIVAEAKELRYSNSIFGVGIHGGEFTMNGGSITVISAGSTKPQFDYVGAVFAGSTPDKVINLNNVAIDVICDTHSSACKNLLAWGGKTVVNTTDAEGSWTSNLIDVRNGGTYEINYVK